MSIRTLFNIVLKIIGILLLKDIITAIISVYSVFFIYTNQMSKTWSMFDLLSTTVITLFAYILLFYFLVFKTEWMVNLLKLERDFDDEPLPLNIHRSTVLRISVFVIGGFMVANSLPDVFRLLIVYCQQIQSYGNHAIKIDPYLIGTVSKVAIGAILIGFQRPIVNLIELKSKG